MVVNKIKRSISQQYLEIKWTFPEVKMKLKKNKLVINIILKPTEISKSYSIEIIYFSSGVCETWLRNVPNNIIKKDIPHIYETDYNNRKIKLCLYNPHKFDWSHEEWISKTIIPWCIEWLFFFELWTAIGIWCGGGDHPTSD